MCNEQRHSYAYCATARRRVQQKCTCWVGGRGDCIRKCVIHSERVTVSYRKSENTIKSLICTLHKQTSPLGNNSEIFSAYTMSALRTLRLRQRNCSRYEANKKYYEIVWREWNGCRLRNASRSWQVVFSRSYALSLSLPLTCSLAHLLTRAAYAFIRDNTKLALMP